MTSKEEIIRFLKQFQDKKRIWQIVFRDDRGKNSKALSELEIIPNQRIEIIDNLKHTDYTEGPLEEKLNKGAEMWVFGKMLKGKEIYIKISMGVAATAPVICISFHIAEKAMVYPYK